MARGPRADERRSRRPIVVGGFGTVAAMTTDSPTSPTMTGISNFREMGGLPAAGGSTVRHGRLFRSGHLAEATDDDLAAVASLGIGSIIDLRTPADHTGDGGLDRVPEGVAHHAIPVVDSSGHNAELREVIVAGDQTVLNERFGNGRAAQLAGEGVAVMATEPEKIAVFAQVLHHVADAAGTPVLWHCSAGKDRAGWAATVVGMALGVPDDALVEHYLLSNVHRPVADRVAHYEALGLDVTAILPLMEVREEYLRAGLAAVDAAWPDRETYLAEAMSFGPERIEALRAAVLT
jgi:protein-tyrosine phosphatase